MNNCCRGVDSTLVDEKSMDWLNIGMIGVVAVLLSYL